MQATGTRTLVSSTTSLVAMSDAVFMGWDHSCRELPAQRSALGHLRTFDQASTNVSFGPEAVILGLQSLANEMLPKEPNDARIEVAMKGLPIESWRGVDADARIGLRQRR